MSWKSNWAQHEIQRQHAAVKIVLEAAQWNQFKDPHLQFASKVSLLFVRFLLDQRVWVTLRKPFKLSVFLSAADPEIVTLQVYYFMWSLQMLFNSVCNCLFTSCHCLCQLSLQKLIYIFLFQCWWCPGSIKAAAKDCGRKRENAFLFSICFPLNSPSVFPAACPPCNLFCCCCGMWDEQSDLPHLQKAAFILEDDW